MENALEKLMDGNQAWVKDQLSKDPAFFEELSKGQSPEFLWLGCADSRVPAEMVTDSTAGDLFVHRNIANVAANIDLNFMSVLQYAVEALKVNHIIVCGHYGCGGIKAAMQNQRLGLIDNWLLNLKDIYQKYAKELEAIEDEDERVNRFVELNVQEQVQNLGKNPIVQKAWEERSLAIHGWVYDLASGKLINLEHTLTSAK